MMIQSQEHCWHVLDHKHVVTHRFPCGFPNDISLKMSEHHMVWGQIMLIYPYCIAWYLTKSANLKTSINKSLSLWHSTLNADLSRSYDQIWFCHSVFQTQRGQASCLITMPAISSLHRSFFTVKGRISSKLMSARWHALIDNACMLMLSR